VINNSAGTYGIETDLLDQVASVEGKAVANLDDINQCKVVFFALGIQRNQFNSSWTRYIMTSNKGTIYTSRHNQQQFR
jgi:hypothetical protein